MTKKTAVSALSVALVLPIVEAFLKKHPGKFTATSLGKAAVKDPNRIHELRAGAQVRKETAHKILAVIDRAVPNFSTEFVAKYQGGK